MQWCAATDGAYHLDAGTFRVSAVDIHNLIALTYRQIHSLIGLAVQGAHEFQCHFTHIQTTFDDIAQFQQTHTQPVTARFRSIHKAADGQIVEDAMGRGGMQSGALADLLE